MNKKFVAFFLSVGILTSIFTGCAKTQDKVTSGNMNATESAKHEIYTRPESVNSDEAKKLLVDGNKRFVSGSVLDKDTTKDKLKKLSGGQNPFAVIVTCSDSRVDPEMIFDQGLGDTFVIRDAGNVVDKVTLGSVEYGAEHLNVPLIVVLGHENCGAVKATVDKSHVSENIQGIVDKIDISFKALESKGISKDKMYQEVEDANIKNTVSEIEKDPIIEELVKENKVKVIGAKYHIETGEVVFE